MEQDLSGELPSQTVTLRQGQELRMENGANGKVFVTLSSGTAELFGSELSTGQKVELSGQKVAVYTWSGCTLQVHGSPDVMYTADETPMASYINIHKMVNNRRLEAQQRAEEGEAVVGPRVIVVGPTDAGKSTLCRLLINYAVRSGFEPTFVDLDVGQGSITAPGCLAASPMEVAADPEEGFPVEVPLVYYYGGTSPSDNPDLYRAQLASLATVLDRREAVSRQAAAAGRIINTLGWIDGLGYDLVKAAISAMRADVVLVLEQDRLYNQLSNELRGSKSVQVIKLAKSGGVVVRPPDARKKAREQRVREYFYGVKGNLMPFSNTVRAEELQVYRIGGLYRAPTSALPIGASSHQDPLRVTKLSSTSPDLLYSLLALSHAETPEQLAASNVAGFILVKEVDSSKGTITYLAPCPGPLPGKLLLAGSFKTYVD